MQNKKDSTSITITLFVIFVKRKVVYKMRTREYPILEYDNCMNALISPNRKQEERAISSRAVLCFFGEAISELKKELPFIVKCTLKFETYFYPIYEFEYKNERINIIHMPVGAPMAACIVDELVASGCDKIIVCGGCGVLVEGMSVGKLFLPVSAIRDEGTSYHYLPPAREVNANDYAVHTIEKVLENQGCEYLKVKTWTTDAHYRETLHKVELRRNEGCTTVEMEAAALMAVAEFRNIILGQILYSGDDLSGKKWDGRDNYSRNDIRKELLYLSLECSINL